MSYHYYHFADFNSKTHKLPKRFEYLLECYFQRSRGQSEQCPKSTRPTTQLSLLSSPDIHYQSSLRILHDDHSQDFCWNHKSLLTVNYHILTLRPTYRHLVSSLGVLESIQDSSPHKMWRKARPMWLELE